MPRAKRLKAGGLVIAMGLGLLAGSSSMAQQTSAPWNVAAAPSLTVGEVVSQLEKRNHERREALRGFQGVRTYKIEYHGPVGDRAAEMTVDVRYQSPDDKQFTVVSQSGSKFLFDRVLKGLLEGEKEAASAENQKRTDLNAENYNFALTGVEATPGGPQYVLSVTPKTDYKYLYRGKIWVDATDFAVTRIAAEPSKTPSFWVKRSEVNHKYEKVDDFWLPAENKTESWIRLGGHAQLSIEYNNYQITEPAASDEEGHARKVVARQN